MKKLLLLVSVMSFLLACNKNNDTNSGNGKIPIKGIISGKSGSKSGREFSMSDAKKVLVFSKYYYSLTDIVNGSFTVNGEIGSGVALIFLDASNQYIGALSTRGLNMLPLGALSDGENTVIDLSTLTLSGKSVIPSHDPFGKEIIISDAEINNFKVLGEYYESMAKNIDADNDGIPDVLSGKELILNTIFGKYSGTWGLNDKEPVLIPGVVRYTLEFAGGPNLTFSDGKIALSGPVEDPYSTITLWGYRNAPQTGANRGFMATFARDGSGAEEMHLPFKKGTYTLTLNGSQNYTLDYANIDVLNSLVIVAPTLHTNSNGKLTSITLDYNLPNGNPIEPSSILSSVMVQLTDSTQHAIYVNDHKRLTYKTGFAVLNLDTPVDITNLMVMDVSYDDLLGNTYLIVWNY